MQLSRVVLERRRVSNKRKAFGVFAATLGTVGAAASDRVFSDSTAQDVQFWVGAAVAALGAAYVFYESDLPTEEKVGAYAIAASEIDGSILALDDSLGNGDESKVRDQARVAHATCEKARAQLETSGINDFTNRFSRTEVDSLVGQIQDSVRSTLRSETPCTGATAVADWRRLAKGSGYTDLHVLKTWCTTQKQLTIPAVDLANLLGKQPRGDVLFAAWSADPKTAPIVTVSIEMGSSAADAQPVHQDIKMRSMQLRVAAGLPPCAYGNCVSLQAPGIEQVSQSFLGSMFSSVARVWPLTGTLTNEQSQWFCRNWPLSAQAPASPSGSTWPVVTGCERGFSIPPAPNTSLDGRDIVRFWNGFPLSPSKQYGANDVLVIRVEPRLVNGAEPPTAVVGLVLVEGGPATPARPAIPSSGF